MAVGYSACLVEWHNSLLFSHPKAKVSRVTPLATLNAMKSQRVVITERWNNNTC